MSIFIAELPSPARSCWMPRSSVCSSARSSLLPVPWMGGRIRLSATTRRAMKPFACGLSGQPSLRRMSASRHEAAFGHGSAKGRPNGTCHGFTRICTVGTGDGFAKYEGAKWRTALGSPLMSHSGNAALMRGMRLQRIALSEMTGVLRAAPGRLAKRQTRRPCEPAGVSRKAFGSRRAPIAGIASSMANLPARELRHTSRRQLHSII